MPVEMIGWIAPRVSSEIIPVSGPPFDADVIAETARVHEQAGFDRVLIGYFSSAPDGFIIGAHAAAKTERLGFLLAHRPGFVAPSVAARKMATLDQLSNGRLAVHLISGGSDVDQAKDGDHMDHAARYRRTAEYAGLLRRVWTETKPFDHLGEFYKFEGAYAEIRCRQEPCIPVYGGGGSDAAIAALASNVDIFMLWGEPLAATAEFMKRVRDTVAPQSRVPEFSLSIRPILAETDDKAWDRAKQILDQATQQLRGVRVPKRQNIGSKRLLDVAAEADTHDTCLWTKLAELTGAAGNSTALVGSPDTVAMALVEYYKAGVKSLLIRGYDPLVDAAQYGAELIPLVRKLVAEDDASDD
jgi:alkanesulfonate monooxygenase